MSDGEQAFERDHDGVALRAVLPNLRKMIESAEGSTTDEKLANWLGFAIASVDLGPEAVEGRVRCGTARSAADRGTVATCGCGSAALTAPAGAGTPAAEPAAGATVRTWALLPTEWTC